MTWWQRLRYRNDLERQLDAELRDHVERLTAGYIAAGMPEDEAWRKARLDFGGLEQVKEVCRDARGLNLLDHLQQDARYALRTLMRNRGFAAVAILTLALGIGANTAIFSVINGVLLRPLPYPEADRLVRINPASGVVPAAGRLPGLDVPELTALRAESRTLSHVGVYFPVTMTLAHGDGAVRLDGTRLSPAVLSMLGVEPLMGRRFDARDDAPGADAGLLLSHAVWQRDFGGDPAVVGQSVLLDGTAFVVVGVMPASFQFPSAQNQFWVPFALPVIGQGRFMPIARVREDVSMQAAAEEVGRILRQLRDSSHAETARPLPFPPGATLDPRAGAGPPPPPPPPAQRPPPPPPPQRSRQDGAGAEADVVLARVQDDLVAPVKPALIVLLAAVGVVLLIACANVASLLLVRAAARQREIAVRAAIGASRGRLTRQVLTESLVLALAGGVAGTALAFGGVHLLRTLDASLPRRDMVSSSIPRLGEVGIDAPVLLFTISLSVLTGLLFGLIPALREWRRDHMDVLRQGTGSATSRVNLFRPHRVHGLLVVAELGMAMMLVVAGGLLIHSFVKLSNVDPGYDPRGVLTFQVVLPHGRSNTGFAEFAEELVARLQSVPGIQAAGYTPQLPMLPWRGTVALRTTPAMPGAPPPPPAPGVQNPPEWPDSRIVSRDFLNVMGMRLIAGRAFEEGDRAGQPQVMLINRALARTGLLGEHPVGTQIYALGQEPWEIIGIVEDVRQFGLDQEPGPQVFFDIRQLPGAAAGAMTVGAQYFAVRTDGAATRLIPAIRGVVRQLDPEGAVDHVAPMELIVSNSISRPRLYAVLLGLFGGVAVILAAVGIYGVIAYSVAQRVREIGVRMALGAGRRTILGLVLRQAVVLTGAGLALGLAGAIGLTRYLEGMLFGITPLDTGTFAAVAILFAAVAMLASYVPARRATKIDPLAALRCE